MAMSGQFRALATYSREECHPVGWMGPTASVEPLQIGYISCLYQGSSHNFSDVHVAAYTTPVRTG